MLEALILLGFVAAFGLGYGTRSYVGVVLPVAVVVWAAIVYQQNMPTADEIRVVYTVFLAASILGVLVYLGGAALGRRSRRKASAGA